MFRAEEKHVHNNDDVEFEVVKAESNDNALSVVVIQGTNQLELIRMIAPADMYDNGLEKNYKRLVDMDTIAKVLIHSLQAFLNIDKLDEDGYTRIINLYKPFIDKSKSFHLLKNFVEEDVW